MTFDTSGLAADVMSAASRGALAGPVQDFNAFMGRINDAVQNPLDNIGGVMDLLGVKNPYARQNVLQNMMARGDPVLAFDWIGVIIDSGMSSASLPWYYIDSLSTPSRQVDTHKYHFNGLDKKFAATASIGEIEIKLFTDANATTFNYAENWFTSTYRRDGFYSLPNQYKKDIAVFVLDAKRKTIVDFRFVGCFPTAYQSYPFGTEGSILETSMTVSVDRVLINTETSLTKAVDRFRAAIPGVIADIGGSVFNLPATR